LGGEKGEKWGDCSKPNWGPEKGRGETSSQSLEKKLKKVLPIERNEFIGKQNGGERKRGKINTDEKKVRKEKKKKRDPTNLKPMKGEVVTRHCCHFLNSGLENGEQPATRGVPGEEGSTTRFHGPKRAERGSLGTDMGPERGGLVVNSPQLGVL